MPTGDCTSIFPAIDCGSTVLKTGVQYLFKPYSDRFPTSLVVCLYRANRFCVPVDCFCGPCGCVMSSHVPNDEILQYFNQFNRVQANPMLSCRLSIGIRITRQGMANHVNSKGCPRAKKSPV